MPSSVPSSLPSSAIRVVSGTQSLLFMKILRLPAGGDTLSGHVANIINNDMERVQEGLITFMLLTC